MGHGSSFALMSGLAITLVAALVGGFAARALRLPVLVGYMMAGIVIGPYTPGFIANEQTVFSLAEIGVALLMFAVGVQFSLKELSHVRRTALVAGSIQILGMVLFGIPVAHLIGWNGYEGLYLGCIMALSSTAVVMRVLEERGELGTAHGTLMMGLSLVQDLAVIPMVLLLPVAAGLQPSGGAATTLVWTLVKATFFLAAMVIVAARLVPPILARVASVGSRELFLLALVCLCLLAGGAAETLGLGMALGAFIAGIVVSESEYAHESLSQIRPLRDVFASVFFVSVGMLLDPQQVVRHWAAVSAVVAAIIAVKAGLLIALIRLLGWRGRTAFSVGFGLANIGEFSFVLLTLGRANELISSEMIGVANASAMVTLMAAPFLLRSAPLAFRGMLHIPWLSRMVCGRHETSETAWLPSSPSAKDHCIIAGSGRIGRYVSDALLAQSVPQVVIDFDAVAVGRRRERGVPVIYGDATSEDVLRIARPASARLAIVSLPEQASAEAVVRLLRKMAPDLPIIARVHSGGDMAAMVRAGADAVIHAEFEAGAQMVRETLARLAVPPVSIDEYIRKLREERYGRRELT